MIHLQREELTEQIGKLNIKIAKANKELDELELKYKKKKLEIRKYKNESVGLQLELQEHELENWKEIQEEQKIKRIQISKKLFYILITIMQEGMQQKHFFFC